MSAFGLQRNLYVCNLPIGIDEGTFARFFGVCGHIESVKLFSEKRYGFVNYTRPEEALLAIAALNGTDCAGSIIMVQPSRNEKGQGKGLGGLGGLGALAGLGGLSGLAGLGHLGGTALGHGGGSSSSAELLRGAGAGRSVELAIKGLPEAATSELVMRIFGRYGAVRSCIVMSDSRGGALALLTVADASTASLMISSLSGKVPDGLTSPVKISLADEPVSAGRAGSGGAGGSASRDGGGGAVARSVAAALVGPSKTAVAELPVKMPSSARSSPYGGGAAAALVGSSSAPTSGGSALISASHDDASSSSSGKPNKMHPLLAAYAASRDMPKDKGYKTRMCHFYLEVGGRCPNGDSCTFAHGPQELGGGWKSRTCKFSAGQCPHGDRCTFAHTKVESPKPTQVVRAAMCKYVLEGANCPRRSTCTDAHDAAELGKVMTMPVVTASTAAALPGVPAGVQPKAAMAKPPSPIPGLASFLALERAAPVSSSATTGMLTLLAQSGVDLNQLAAAGVDLHNLAASLLKQQDAGASLLGLTGCGGGAGLAALEAADGLPKGFKTRLCTFFIETGTCVNGANCTFAHGTHEILGYKTRMCKFAANPALCPQGALCSFAHSAGELKM